jgi:hypothetical protein
MKQIIFLFILLSHFVWTIPFAASDRELNCDAQEYRQLDFWIGEWNVIDQSTEKQVGTSRIEKLLKGCVIFESWSGEDQFKGNSFNLYNREINKWQQVWVDSRGQRIDFTGEFRADGMHYEGPFVSGGKRVLSRMKFLKLDHDRVRQIWEQSADEGKTWKTLFQGIYIKKSES